MIPERTTRDAKWRFLIPIGTGPKKASFTLITL
jgi:hypothetical protein